MADESVKVEGVVEVAGTVSIEGPVDAVVTSLSGEVEVKNDSGNPLPVIQVLASGTPTHQSDITVDGTSGGVTLLAANANRKGVFIQNTGIANMRVSLGGIPTATTGIQLAGGQIMALSTPFIPVGTIKAIRESGTSTTAAVVEIV